jgi:hypothetical protein
MRFIFNLFEKQFLKYLLTKHSTGMTKDNLTFAFADLDSNLYYQFPKEVALPMVRIAKLQEYYTWLSAGLTGDELVKMVDKADEALSNGLKDSKGVAKIGFILSEIKDRKNMVVNEEIYYNILAAQLVRHDEDVSGWNNDIQMQKVQAFKEMDNAGTDFFLYTQELRSQLGWSNTSREELRKLFHESMLKVKAMSEMLERL